MKKVVLAEKPSVGRDIARVLKCEKQGNGFLEGKDYIVTWALGHLVTLADPESYDKKYKTWNMDDLPMLPKPYKLVVMPKTRKQFNTVKEQLHRKDVNEIIIATDAGREGELVARWIIEKAGVKKPLKRLWISSVTDKAIKEGFTKLKNGHDYDHLYESAIARSEADWVVGINATRALTTKHNAQLSCGRVQTPTLSMIAAKEAEIKSFVPTAYYGLSAKVKGFNLIWQDVKTNETRCYDEARIQTLERTLKQLPLVIESVNVTPKKSYPKGLYDLTELQRDANRIFNFSAKETLGIMQKLYEQHKCVTYPRTDSKFISTDIVPTLKDRVKAVAIGSYRPIANGILNAQISGNKSFVDNEKVSDHHAIIPTEQGVVLQALSDKEKKIFDLIVKRFLSVLSRPSEYEQTKVIAKIGQERFVASGVRVISLGYKAIYEGGLAILEEEDEKTLPKLEVGQSFDVISIGKTTGQTKPPAHFTEGTLLGAMENPTRYMTEASKSLKQTMGVSGGLGTVATRADIIEKLFNSFYVEKQGQAIRLTSKGRQLLELAPKDLTSPILTAQWEQKLTAIASGTLKRQVFMSEMESYAKLVVDEIKQDQTKFKHDNLTTTRCSECGDFMLSVNGKRGKMLVCQNRECKTKKVVTQTTNARCPQCHKRLELRGEGDAAMFACVCGFREKLSTFKKRKSDAKKTGSKRDVQKYLKQQDKQEEPLNNPFADALAGLKLDK